jgi:hypothetical protein
MRAAPALRRALACTLLGVPASFGTANAQLIPTPPPVSTPAPAPAPAPTPSQTGRPAPLLDDSHVIGLVKAEFERMRAGSVDRTKYTSELALELTETQVKLAGDELRPLGAPLQYTLSQTIAKDGRRVYQYVVKCEHGVVLFTVAFTAKNLEDGVFLRPL